MTDAQKIHNKNRYEKVKKEGRCIICGKLRGDNGTLACAECRKHKNLINKVKGLNRYYGKIEIGVCVKCGKPKDANTRMCAECIEVTRKYMIKYRNHKRLERCVQLATGGSQC